MRNPGDDNTSVEFEDLTLDQIRLISQADLVNADGIEQQAMAAGQLSEQLTEAIRNLGHCWGMVNQASLVSVTDELMSTMIHTPLEGGRMLARHDTEKLFQGESARVTITQLDVLGTSSKNGSTSIKGQPDTLKTLAGQVRQADTEMTALFEERREYLDLIASDPQNPKLSRIPGVTPGMTPELLAHAVNVEYDHRARTTMGGHVNGYYEQARSIPSPPAYDGPRTEAPAPMGLRGRGDVDSSGGGERYGPGGHNASGPSVADLDERSRREQTGSSRPPTSSYGPELTSTAAPSGPTYQPGPAQPPATTAFGQVGIGGHFVPNQPVIRPVMGGRTGPTGLSARQPMRPNTSGLVRPVIGERPGKAYNAFGRPQRPVVRGVDPRLPGGQRTGSPRVNGFGQRPVNGVGQRAGTGSAQRPFGARTGSGSAQKTGFGQRSATGSGSRTTGVGQRGAPRRPGFGTGSRSADNPAPRSLGRDGRVVIRKQAGVRGPAEPAHSADGRVIRSRPPARATVIRAEFDRGPSLVHGGNENRDVAALRNALIPGDVEHPGETAAWEPPQPPAEPEPVGDWYPATPVLPPVIRGARELAEPVDHDPGHYVTRFNMGRRW